MKVGDVLMANYTRIRVTAMRDGKNGPEVKVEYAGQHDHGVRSERWYPVLWLLETGWVKTYNTTNGGGDGRA